MLTPLELKNRVLTRLAPFLKEGDVTADEVLGQLRALDQAIAVPVVDPVPD